MNKPFSWIRAWFVPIGLVLLAGLLTVPWSYLVLRAAYDRDVTENARSLAHRVEFQREMTYADAGSALDVVFPMRGEARKRHMATALTTEIGSDPSVQTLIFYNILYEQHPAPAPPTPALAEYLAIIKKSDSVIKRLSVEDVVMLRDQGMLHISEKGSQTQQFFIPWKREGRVVGITYVELSNAALAKDFWKKESALLFQVVAWSTTGVLALSAVGIFAYRSWQKAGHVQQRAELAQQGLLAERGLTAAVLAHEIRNPLQALRFQLHSLRRNSQDPDRVTATSETIDSELLRIQQLVTDYLEHEKAASVRVQSVDLQEAAIKLKTVMNELLRNTDTRLTIVPPPEPVHVTCDPHALRQILMNLVLNAQQAMGPGGSITLRIARDEHYGILDLTDTGPGIPQEMQARLFKPFQTSKKDGHGIGLALVKRFVDNFGGSVTVESELGKGTTFHLKLPLAESTVPTDEPAVPLNKDPEPQKIEV
ncbi:MAG: multi-sensor signal transduction histidine kinase [Phycisphaerales bacterium]|nr:multi-sensor signal transduction histidine kinase [Phycisphaerales bacterium]